MLQDIDTMKFVVIDVQGFPIPEFEVKELSIYDGKEMKTYTFKPKICYHHLPIHHKKTINYIFHNVHGIPYNSGYLPYKAMYNIIQEELEGVDMVFVKGSIKKEFLLCTYNEMNLDPPCIVNLEFTSGPVPKLEQSYSNNCNYHRLEICSCTVNNAHILYDYIINLLTQ